MWTMRDDGNGRATAIMPDGTENGSSNLHVVRGFVWRKNHPLTHDQVWGEMTAGHARLAHPGVGGYSE